MKNLIINVFTFGLLLFSTIAFAGNVPEAIEASFKETFKEVKVLKWKHYKGYYQVKFKDANNNVGYALYNSEGRLIEKDQPATMEQLPDKYKSIISRSYSEAEVRTIYIISRDGEQDTYLVRLTNPDNQEFEVEFNN